MTRRKKQACFQPFCSSANPQDLFLVRPACFSPPPPLRKTGGKGGGGKGDQNFAFHFPSQKFSPARVWGSAGGGPEWRIERLVLGSGGVFRRSRRFCFSCPFFSPGVSRPPELEWRIGMEMGKADGDDAYLEIER